MYQNPAKLQDKLVNLLEQFKQGDIAALKNICSLLRHDITPGHAEIQSTIAGLLKSGNEDIRVFAAASLGCLRTAGVPSVPQLIEAMQTDSSLQVVKAAAASLGAIRCQQSTEAIIKMLDHPSLEDIALHVFRALGDLGKEAQEALPALQRLQVESGDEIIRELAREAGVSIRVDMHQGGMDLNDQ